MALFELAVARVADPVVHRLNVKRLAFHHDRADFAGLEAALGLHGSEQLLVVQVPVAEVPAERHAGDDLAVGPGVVVEMIDGFGN